MAPCPDGSVEYRLTPAALYVYRSVCHAFPQITSYGGVGRPRRARHGQGARHHDQRRDAGGPIAAFLQATRLELHIYDILWRQHIWPPVRAVGGLAAVRRPRVGDGQPLRPRARLGLLSAGDVVGVRGAR